MQFLQEKIRNIPPAAPGFFLLGSFQYSHFMLNTSVNRDLCMYVWLNNTGIYTQFFSWILQKKGESVARLSAS